MPTLSSTKDYADTTVLFEADLDAILDDYEEFFNTTKVNDANFQDAGLTASTVITDASISTGKINAAAITTAKIADGTVGSSNVAADNAVLAKIADSTISTANLASTTIATGKIADSTITRAKLSTPNYTLSSSTGTSVQITATSATDVTNLTATITTNGRPIEIRTVPANGASTNCKIFVASGFSTESTFTFSVVRDSTTVWSATARPSYATAGAADVSTTQYPASSIWHIDAPSEGTYTYKIQASISSASGNNAITFQNVKLLVREL